jgi:hypothetical protein
MPAPYQRAGLCWCTFLPHAPRCYAVTRIHNQDQRIEKLTGRASSATTAAPCAARTRLCLDLASAPASIRLVRWRSAPGGCAVPRIGE